MKIINIFYKLFKLKIKFIPPSTSISNPQQSRCKNYNTNTTNSRIKNNFNLIACINSKVMKIVFGLKNIINSVKHYENFPIASLFLPKDIRQAVQHIYKFARSADDIADEGEYLPYERLKKLYLYSKCLNYIQSNELSAIKDKEHNFNVEFSELYHTDVKSLFINLDNTIKNHNLSIKYFQHLIHAFRQDVIKNNYQTKQQVLEYCNYSANPVGRILLELYKRYNNANTRYSDSICTALQLINFYQDVEIDYLKNRFYLSYDILYENNLSLDDIKGLCKFSKNNDPKKHSCWMKWQQMMHTQVKYAQDMLLSGLPLCNQLPFRMNKELKCIIYAANIICNKLHKIDYNVFTKRPILKWYDWVTIITKAIVK